MKSIFFLLVICLLWTYSFYHHFIAESPQTTMIAFVGSQHSQLFASIFDGYGDLWAFGHRRRRSLKIRFEKKGTQFDFFLKSNYQHMLVVQQLVHLPMMFDSEIVVQYRRENNTVATLWPRSVAVMSRSSEWLEVHSEKIYIA